MEIEEARRLWHEATDDELKARAAITRRRFHLSGTATYRVMGIVNTTNVCVAQCDYCAFYVSPGHPDGYALSREEAFARIDSLIAQGADLVCFNGGFNPSLSLDDHAALFFAIRERYRDAVAVYALTIAEFIFLADRARVPYIDAARMLSEAGVRWITGGGAEILTNDFRRRHSRMKYSVEEFFAAQRAVLSAGIKTTATMVIGFDETLDERLEHLKRTRDFQDETGGLSSFLCWTYKSANTVLGGEEIGPAEYLRHIALSRIVLDNIAHIRTSVLTMNTAAFRALDYGADDFDIALEDEVTETAGARVQTDVDAVLDIPKRMGYQLAYRGRWACHSRGCPVGGRAAW